MLGLFKRKVELSVKQGKRGKFRWTARDAGAVVAVCHVVGFESAAGAIEDAKRYLRVRSITRD